MSIDIEIPQIEGHEWVEAPTDGSLADEAGRITIQVGKSVIRAVADALDAEAK